MDELCPNVELSTGHNQSMNGEIVATQPNNDVISIDWHSPAESAADA
jgi:hypothetical protein